MERLRNSIVRAVHRWSLGGSALARGLHDETGSALIELASVLAFFGIPLLLGTIYTGVLMADYIEITNAAHTGAMYGMRSSTWAEDNTGIITAAQADAYHLGTDLTVTPSIYYVCSDAQDGTQYATQTAAATACTGGTTHPLEFIQVVASAPITPPSTFPGLPKTMTLSSISAMEVEE
jgi:Flp pilus assembly protein TadG